MVNRLNIVLRFSLILFGVAAMPGVSLAVIHAINLDLGIDTQQSLIPGYNNLTGPALTEPTTTLNLIDIFGAATGITLTPTWSAMDNDTGVALPAANFQGRYPDEIPGIAQSALRDNVWVRDGQSLTLTLNNLPANTAYNFLFYGAAGETSTGDYSLWTVTGSNSGSDFIVPLVANHTQVATVNGILPNANNRITVRFEGRRPDGTPQLPGVNDDGLGRFNYMRILEHSSIAGDFDANGVVNDADYTTWRSDFGRLAHTTGADGNHNGVVDAADYVLWRKGMTAGGGGAGASSDSTLSVPEPHAAALVGALVLSCCGFRVRRRCRLPR
jgi:hypothetical protein